MNYAIKSTVQISDIKITLPPPVNYPATEGPYGAMGTSDPRAATAVDINGDGWLDIFLHPSYFAYEPGMSPIVLLNDGTGKFFDGTAQVFKTAPVLQQTNNVFFEDFNKDGRPDMFVVDQGLEIAGKTGANFDGAINQLFLQGADGSFTDATATLPHNARNFNHVSSLGDVNGDGNPDIVLTTLGGSTFEGQGTAFYLGNGAGGFTYTTAGLPETIKFMANTVRQWNSKTIDYQFSGTTAVGDLNNDGRADLVAGSYTSNDLVGGNRTVRSFEQQANGEFVQKWSGSQPAALVSSMGVMGVAGLKTGDLDGDGLQDIVVMWENGGKSAIQVLKNLDGSQFSDTTVAWLGSYLARSFVEEGSGYYQSIASAIELVDFNRDGKLDLYIKQYGVAAPQLAAGSSTGAFLFLNDGAGHLSAVKPTSGGTALTSSQLAAMTSNHETNLGVPLVFDANNDGATDMVFIEPFHDMNQALFPYRPTTLHVSTLYGEQGGHIYRAGDLGDYLAGSATSDTFFSGKGNDKFSGGGGTDTVVYGGAFNSYKLGAVNGTFVVRDAGGIGSADTMTGVERLTFSNASVALFHGNVGSYQISKGASGITVTGSGAAPEMVGSVERILFHDATVRFDVNGVGGQAYRVYQAAFGRTPDAGGLGYWIGAMDSGTSLATVASGFASSQEFRDVYGAAPTSREIIGKFYKNVLQREGEKAGVDYWAGVLDAKAATVAEVLMGFSESAENQAALVGVISNGISYTPFG